MTLLRQWWTKKYRRPITSTEWLNSDITDICVDFFEDLYQNSDEMARKARLKYLGYEFQLTGDHFVDYWEQQIARGEVPDLKMDMTQEEKDHADRVWKRVEERFQREGTPHYVPIKGRIASLPKNGKTETAPKPTLDEYDTLFEDLDYTDKAGMSMNPGDMSWIDEDAFDAFLNAAHMVK